MRELWGVEILVFPLTSHIAYTTSCCYRTSRDSFVQLMSNPTEYQAYVVYMYIK